MLRMLLVPVTLIVVLAVAFAVGTAPRGGGMLAVAQGGSGSAYEVWAIDQSDTTADGGGTLYIVEGGVLTGDAQGAPEVIDLGGAVRAFCLERSGTAPRRPHMMLFNAAHSHALITFVATGHVLFMETASRSPVACIDVGEQAHAAYPAANQEFAIVANQNGKLLQRIRTNYAANTFTLEEHATLNLATCTTPSGAPCQDMTLRPDNAPICPVLDAAGRWAFVTLRGGGLLVVDATATPMAIIAEYDQETIAPNGCGGIERGGTMYINAGGGTMTVPLRADLYAIPMAGLSATPSAPNTPAPLVVFKQTGRVDSHGAALMRGGAVLWVGDRAGNKIVIVDTASNTVIGEIDLTGRLSDDPAPDLMDVSPDGGWAFMTLRGPLPLTGNIAVAANAVGATPGIGVVRVNEDGRGGAFVNVARITHLVDGNEAADPHAIAVRRK
jgi:hypothetical protein